MNVRGFFKNVLNSEQTQDTSAIPPDDPNSGTLGSGMSGFLSGTTRFLDTVQNKKNGLLNDLTTKFSGIKLPGDQSGGRTKRKKTSRVQENEGDEESSASEYGDEGDKPMYAERAPLESQESVDSVDSLPEQEAEQCKAEIRTIISTILQQNAISPDLEANFQNYSMHHTGRSAFAKELKRQTNQTKELPASVLNQLGQYASHVLVHCNENDDFAPATQIMQRSFTLYHEVRALSMDEHGEQHYLFTLLHDQPIWQSMRFWNAAFFIALQTERRNQTIPAGLRDDETLLAEKEQQENAAFIQISKFVWRMHAFGIPRESCVEFLRKQANGENLSKDRCRILHTNLQKLYETEARLN